MRVDFYHLTLRPLARVLPQIAEKVLGGGGRLLVVSGDAGERAALDQALWSYAPESFLPHAQAGGDFDAEQPVLIADAVTPANAARNVALADGVWRDEALAFERVFHFFGEDTIAEARAAWRALGAHQGLERHYWKQAESGRWEQVA